MSFDFKKFIYSIVTASVIVTGFSVTSDATELRYKPQTGQQTGIGSLTTGTMKGGGGAADLLIDPPSAIGIGLPETGFCGPWNGGNPTVQMVVSNLGGTQSAASQVSVVFSNGAIENTNAPAIGPGQSAVVDVPIPGDAWSSQFHGSVQFQMTANSTNVVDESNTANNTQSGHCIGPAT